MSGAFESDSLLVLVERSLICFCLFLIDWIENNALLIGGGAEDDVLLLFLVLIVVVGGRGVAAEELF